MEEAFYIKKSSGVPAPDDLNLTLLVVKKVLNI
ncbi:unknown [Parabacteroides johnsonii CAG:246]|nr:unknown [Parabacteroides johnsonii CAG:246]